MDTCSFLENEPYFIAEVNSSHNGNMNTAKAMIDKAKEAGCHCVKFQSWSAETLYSIDHYKANPISKRIVSKFSFNEEQLLEAANYCKEIGISFASTPYSISEVDFLVKIGVPFIKVASMDINNYPFLEYIAKTDMPIVLSTGMADMEEIQEAVKVIEKTGNKKLCLLHCISIYPPELSTIRLLNIVGLQETFTQYPIGFSDHSLGIEIAPAAIALGAKLVEKHLTLDRNQIGMDNQMALEPEELKQLVTNCNNVHKALGGKERIVLEAELAQRTKMRRSVIVTRDVKQGEVLKLEDLDAKRPGTSLAPKKIFELAGKTVLRDINADSLINYDDIKW